MVADIGVNVVEVPIQVSLPAPGVGNPEPDSSTPSNTSPICCLVPPHVSINHVFKSVFRCCQICFFAFADTHTTLSRKM